MWRKKYSDPSSSDYFYYVVGFMMDKNILVWDVIELE